MSKALVLYRRNGKSLVVHKVSWWRSHPLNIKAYCPRISLRWLHFNLEFLVFGISKFNGLFTIRIGNREAHFNY